MIGIICQNRFHQWPGFSIIWSSYTFSSVDITHHSHSSRNSQTYKKLDLSTFYTIDDYFKTLQHVNFPRLRILKFTEKSPRHEYFVRFLEINGENLRAIHLDSGDNSSNLAIAKLCPNLNSLCTRFRKGQEEVETLKMILNDCHQLKSIKVWGDNGHDIFWLPRVFKQAKSIIGILSHII